MHYLTDVRISSLLPPPPRNAVQNRFIFGFDPPPPSVWTSYMLGPLVLSHVSDIIMASLSFTKESRYEKSLLSYTSKFL